MSLRHNHGASVSGTKSEKKLKTLTESLGLPFIKERLWGKTLFKPPKHWSQKTKTGKQRKFIADGYIEVPGKKSIIVEQKHSDKHGTTEEKVFYDLKKIEFGVYGKEHELWYVFTGNVSQSVEVYKEFAAEAKRLKLPVKVIWGFEQYKNELEKYIKEV